MCVCVYVCVCMCVCVCVCASFGAGEREREEGDEKANTSFHSSASTNLLCNHLPQRTGPGGRRGEHGHGEQ